MKREIRTVDAEKNLVQITTPDSRWYARIVNQESGNPIWDYVPSTSWICGFYHKSEGLLRFVGKHGYEEAQEIKELAGEAGDKVHQGVNRLVNGGSVAMEDSFISPITNQPEPLTPDEYWRLMTFVEWFEKTRPEVLRTEYTVWHEKHRYAGTVDLVVRIGDEVWLIDVKTSSQIWPSMELQVSAYKHADTSLPKGVRLAILQVGYKANKIQKYKFTEVPDRFPLFLATRKIWKHETNGQKPFQRDYPLSISLSPELVLRESGATA